MLPAPSGGSGGGWQGMDVEQVQTLARQLQDLGERTQKLVHKIDSEVNELVNNWHGDDSRRFHQEWTGGHKAVLVKAAKLLEEMGQKGLHQAQQQAATSNH